MCWGGGGEGSVEIWAVHQKKERILIKVHVVSTFWCWQHPFLISIEEHISKH